MFCHIECAVIASIKEMNEKGKPGLGETYWTSVVHISVGDQDEMHQMEIEPNISLWSVNASGALTSCKLEINMSVIIIINCVRGIGSAGCGPVHLFSPHYVIMKQIERESDFMRTAGTSKEWW